MYSFLNVQKLLEVVDFFLQENIIQNDDDTFVADVVIKCLKKQIDAIENYTIEYIYNKNSSYNDEVLDVRNNLHEDEILTVGNSLHEDEVLAEGNGLHIDKVLTVGNSLHEDKALVVGNREDGDKEENESSTNYSKTDIEKMELNFDDEADIKENTTDSSKYNEEKITLQMEAEHTINDVNVEEDEYIENESYREEYPLIYMCPHCENFYEKTSQLRDHVEEVHQITLYPESCPICFKTFSKHSLTAHMESFHSDMQWPCKICDRSLKSRKALRVHYSMYHGDDKMDKVPCHICGVSITKINLQGHMVNRHNTEEKSIPCPDCGKKFYSKGQAKTHQIIVHGSRRFKCNQCDHRAFTKASLKTHEITHSEERPFSCQFCDQTCKSKQILTNHIKNRHSNNEKKHACDICGKAFKSTTHVHKHRKIHTREYEGYCDICGKAFVQKSNYLLHMKKHHQ